MTSDQLLDFLYEKTGFYDCAQLADAFKMLRDTLILINERKVEIWPKNSKLAFASWNERFSLLIGSKDRPGLSCWWLYWIDHIGLTEHGGSVPGWLTDKGKEVLKAMIEIGESDKEVNAFLTGEY